jgi:hypothetical protein
MLSAEVHRRYPADKLLELVAYIEKGPGFVSPEKRIHFPGAITSWAMQHIPHEFNDYPKPPAAALKPDASKSHKTLLRIAKEAKLLKKLIENCPQSG